MEKRGGRAAAAPRTPATERGKGQDPHGTRASPRLNAGSATAARAPNEKWGDYNGMKKAIDWLVGIGDDTTWINEMEKMAKETAERDRLGEIDVTARLFRAN